MRKAIDFDLRVADLKQYYGNNYTYAYKEIENFFLKHGFEHDQGSGYISKSSMNYVDTYKVLFNLHNTFPWLIKCVDDLRFTSIGNIYDGTKVILDYINECESNENINEAECDLNEEDNEYTV